PPHHPLDRDSSRRSCHRHRGRRQSHLAAHPQPGCSQLPVAFRGDPIDSVHRRPQQNGRVHQLALHCRRRLDRRGRHSLLQRRTSLAHLPRPIAAFQVSKCRCPSFGAISCSPCPLCNALPFFFPSSKPLCEDFPMPSNAQANLRKRKLLLAFVLALLAAAILYAISENRPWKIPEEARRRVNPVPFSPAALAAGRAVYLDKCVQCHGETGKGDGPDAASYYPHPASLTDTKHMNGVTDGEIFYQISQGRKPMPAFKKRLTEEQRWQLVLLVRAFAAPESSSH